MSFNALLKLLSIDKETHVNALQISFLKTTIFLQWLCKNIWKNPIGIHVGNLWQENTNVQFILDPYVAAIITHII
jgi:hypothetical protein